MMPDVENSQFQVILMRAEGILNVHPSCQLSSDLAVTLEFLNPSKIMQKDIHSTKLKQVDSPYFQFTVKNVHFPSLSKGLILFYPFSLSVFLYWSDQGRKQLPGSYMVTLKNSNVFPCHSSFTSFQMLHSLCMIVWTVDLSFENAKTVAYFWRIREEYFLLSQFI